MKVQILIRPEGGAPRTEVLLATGPITIGRHASCTLRLDSDRVSRQHAVVEVIGGRGLRVEDVSTNGTLAGEQLLRRDALEVPFGTPIVVGEFTIAIHPEGMRAAGPTATSGAFAHPAPPHPAPPQGAPFPPHGASRPPVPPAAGSGPLPAFGPSGASHAGPMPGPPGPPNPYRGGPELASNAAKGGGRGAELAGDVALRREIHKLLLEHLDLATIDVTKLDDPSMRPKVLDALRRIVGNLDMRIPRTVDRQRLIGELADEALGLGPLERFLSDASVSEIMVVDPSTIYVEQGGKILLSDARFTDDERVRAVIERIVTPLGRRIDESSPIVDARLKDGSRVNAVIKPIALRGSCITIRKFAKVPLKLDDLIKKGSMTDRIARFLVRSVIAKRNIVISGGTGSGKTTLLNVLSGAIPADERIVTIEDAAELQLGQPHVVSLETKTANLEGKGEYTIRDLVKNALRMRPDRIVVGECRGGEALDMLQAMNTGHDGSLTTTHANSPIEAISRLETLVLMAGVDLPVRAIREQIAASVHVIVQQSRLSDGSRRITAVSEVIGIERDTGEIELRPIFQYVKTSTDALGKITGEFRATGYLPSYLQQFVIMGLVKPGEPYL